MDSVARDAEEARGPGRVEQRFRLAGALVEDRVMRSVSRLTTRSVSRTTPLHQP
jgi:hypothetical protein